MSCVVIIDDSVVVRKIIETSLHRVGVSCISYSDGYEALRAFRGKNYVPDLIFLDINMPRIGGFDLLRVLKTSPQFDRVPIVMLTGRDGLLDKIKSRIAGAQGYLTKPFKTEDILSVVAYHLAVTSPPVNYEDMPTRPAPTRRTAIN